MTTNRKVTGTLSVVLLALLAWSVFSGAGDIWTWFVLGAGATLGSIYTVIGRIPDWLVNQSSGSITEDDDPSNLSPRLYLPILLGAVLIGVAAFVIGVLFL